MDLIDRQAAIDAADSTDYTGLAIEDVKKVTDEVIKALKRLPSAQPEEYTIEMQEADIDEAMKRLRDARVTILPSAEPEIIRCKDCKHRYVEDMIWHCPFGLMGGENFFCGYGSLGIVERRTDE